MSGKVTAKYALFSPRCWMAWIMVCLLWFVVRLPYQWSMLVGRRLGQLARCCLTRRAMIARKNITLCFPNETSAAQRTLLHQHFDALGMGVIETGIAWWRDTSFIQPMVHLDGMAHIEAARERGKGAIILGGHFTCLEFAGRMFGLLSDQLCVTYRESHHPVIDYLLTKHRKRCFNQAIHRYDIRGLLRALRHNKLVWYAPDQDYGPKHSVFAPFFGHPAATITALSRLCRIADTVILPSHYYRDYRSGQYRMIISPPLPQFPSGESVKDATIINQCIERAIMQCPEQYYWVHRRFKTRPPGEHESIYC